MALYIDPNGKEVDAHPLDKGEAYTTNGMQYIADGGEWMTKDLQGVRLVVAGPWFQQHYRQKYPRAADREEAASGTVTAA